MMMNANAQTCHSLEELEKMIGNWSFETETEIITESWIKISHHSFEGVGHSINKFSDERNTETLRLVEMSGDIFYIAKVSHNNLPVAFKLTSCTVKQFIFENPDHDFPQKLTYDFKSDHEIHVLVSGNSENDFLIKYMRMGNEF
jgi:hypothetical protein